MRAITVREYGGPEILRVDEVSEPEPGEGEIVVRQQASSVNPLDWHTMRGTPYFVRVGRGLRRPTKPVLGSDISGVVDAVGPGVERWSIGDAVIGFGIAAWAERVVVKAEGVVARPPGSIRWMRAEWGSRASPHSRRSPGRGSSAGSASSSMGRRAASARSPSSS